MLLVRLLAFALGGAASVAFHLQLKVSMLWSVMIGIAAYTVIDFIAEYWLLGHVG